MSKGPVSLTLEEKRVAKALLAKGWRNQDIHALINVGRKVTFNGGRVTGVKKDTNLQPADDEEVDFFLLKKRSYDQQTGLNRYDDERLIRSREAMILAVQVFNSAALRFKTEVFTMLANVAWTYLMHEWYSRNTEVELVNHEGYSKPLSELIERNDCPISEGVKQNLRALKIMRDKVEHHLLGKADQKWLGIFQACCLNFDKALCDLFGKQLTLANELSFALQFASMNLDQVVSLNQYELPPDINAIDALITDGMTPEQLNNIEFQFQVVYTLDAASKSKSHIQFVSPTSAEGKEIHNVLAKKVISDDLYPLKPGKVVKEVAKKTKKRFTSHTHQQAVRFFKVRPKTGAPQPENTDKTHCIYHPVYKAYAYSPEWVEKLVRSVNDQEVYSKIKAVKLQ
jgi:hypothetical protein